VKRKTTDGSLTDAAAGLERIIHLEQRLARAPLQSRLHRALRAAVRIEAAAYCRALDAEQAAATHDKKPSRDADVTREGVLPSMSRARHAD
jgi:hypothetical protein